MVTAAEQAKRHIPRFFHRYFSLLDALVTQAETGDFRGQFFYRIKAAPLDQGHQFIAQSAIVDGILDAVEPPCGRKIQVQYQVEQ
jgi:hypothetical protein